MSSRGLLGDGATERVVPSIPETLQMFQTIYRDPAHRYRVLDFGGGFALSYFLLRRRMPHESRWAVVETTQSVALGKAFETENLRFFDSIETARQWLGEVDAVHTNGALQYHPSPEAALESLLSVRGAAHLAPAMRFEPGLAGYPGAGVDAGSATRLSTTRWSVGPGGALSPYIHAGKRLCRDLREGWIRLFRIEHSRKHRRGARQRHRGLFAQ